MSKTVKEIVISVTDKGSLKIATKEVDKLNASINNTNTASRKASKGAQELDRNMKGASKQSSNTTKNFSKMAQGMNGVLVPAYATVAATVFAAGAAFRALKNAADMTILEKSMVRMSNVTGISLNSLSNRLQEVTGYAINARQAMQAAAVGVSAGFSSEQVEGMAKAARMAATALGRDLAESMDRVTKGIIKAEPELLDELGIILRLEPATKKYAKALGKNAKDLTTWQKSQAVYNEVLDQTNKKFADFEEADVNVFSKLEASFDNLSKKMLSGIATVFTPLVEFLNSSPSALGAAIVMMANSVIKKALPGMKELLVNAHAVQDRMAALHAQQSILSKGGSFASMAAKGGQYGRQAMFEGFKQVAKKLGKDFDTMLGQAKEGRTYKKARAAGASEADALIQGFQAKIRNVKAADIGVSEDNLKILRAKDWQKMGKLNATHYEKGLKAGFGKVQSSIRAFNLGMIRSFTEVGGAMEGKGIFSGAKDGFKQVGESARKQSGVVSNSLVRIGGAVTVMGSTVMKAIPIVGQLWMAWEMLSMGWNALTEWMGLTTVEFGLMEKATSELTDEVEGAAEKYAMYERNIARSNGTLSESARLHKQLGNIIGEYTDKLDKATAANRAAELARAGAISRARQEGIFGTGLGGDVKAWWTEKTLGNFDNIEKQIEGLLAFADAIKVSGEEFQEATGYSREDLLKFPSMWQYALERATKYFDKVEEREKALQHAIDDTIKSLSDTGDAYKKLSETVLPKTEIDTITEKTRELANNFTSFTKLEGFDGTTAQLEEFAGGLSEATPNLEILKNLAAAGEWKTFGAVLNANAVWLETMRKAAQNAGVEIARLSTVNSKLSKHGIYTLAKRSFNKNLILQQKLVKEQQKLLAMKGTEGESTQANLVSELQSQIDLYDERYELSLQTYEVNKKFLDIQQKITQNEIEYASASNDLYSIQSAEIFDATTRLLKIRQASLNNEIVKIESKITQLEGIVDPIDADAISTEISNNREELKKLYKDKDLNDKKFLKSYAKLVKTEYEQRVDSYAMFTQDWSRENKSFNEEYKTASSRFIFALAYTFSEAAEKFAKANNNLVTTMYEGLTKPFDAAIDKHVSNLKTGESGGIGEAFKGGIRDWAAETAGQFLKGFQRDMMTNILGKIGFETPEEKARKALEAEKEAARKRQEKLDLIFDNISKSLHTLSTSGAFSAEGLTNLQNALSTAITEGGSTNTALLAEQIQKFENAVGTARLDMTSDVLTALRALSTSEDNLRTALHTDLEVPITLLAASAESMDTTFRSMADDQKAWHEEWKQTPVEAKDSSPGRDTSQHIRTESAPRLESRDDAWLPESFKGFGPLSGKDKEGGTEGYEVNPDIFAYPRITTLDNSEIKANAVILNIPTGASSNRDWIQEARDRGEVKPPFVDNKPAAPFVENSQEPGAFFQNAQKYTLENMYKGQDKIPESASPWLLNATPFNNRVPLSSMPSPDSRPIPFMPRPDSRALEMMPVIQAIEEGTEVAKEVTAIWKEEQGPNSFNVYDEKSSLELNNIATTLSDYLRAMAADSKYEDQPLALGWTAEGPSDALRHSTAAAFQTNKIGEGLTRHVGKLNELAPGGLFSPEGSIKQDLWNNEAGILVGSKIDSMAGILNSILLIMQNNATQGGDNLIKWDRSGYKSTPDQVALILENFRNVWVPQLEKLEQGIISELPSRLEAEAAYKATLKGATPGSFYVHDIKTENAIKNSDGSNIRVVKESMTNDLHIKDDVKGTLKTGFSNVIQNGHLDAKNLAASFAGSMASKAADKATDFIFDSIPWGDLFGGFFAKGGIAEGGFRAFASGGTVKKPTLGLVGEGKYNEAVVPLPDGKSIPVMGSTGGGDNTNNITINVNVDQDGNAKTETQQEGGGMDGESAQQLGYMVSQAVQAELVEQQRPGGLLSRYQ